MKLYELSESYRMLQRMEESEGVNFVQALEDLQDEAEFKLVNIAKLLREIEAEETAISVEIQRLQNKKRAVEKKTDSLKAYVQANMETLGMREAADEIIKISLHDCPPSCRVTDESIIPSNFIEYTLNIPGHELPEDMHHFVKEHHVNKGKVLKSWKDGVAIPGTDVVKESSVRIR